MTPTDRLTRRAVLTAAGSTALAAPALLGPGPALAQPKPQTLLNVSYDPTRELYQGIDQAFAAFWKKRTGQALQINQSHGGSGAQARAVIDGLQADIVTLALAYDIDEISRKTKRLPANWQSRLPFNSTPYTSTIVFLVRKGNPKKIRDWNDLIGPGVELIAPNPKTGGGARWIYLAAWSWAKSQRGGSDDSAKRFVQKLYKQVTVLDTGSRGSTTTFTERKIGDVLLGWENEAYLALDQLKGQYEIVTPSRSILAEPPVAVVDGNADKHGVRTVAEAYLNFLYSPLAQDLIGKNHYRPRNAAAVAKYASKFPSIPLATINDFGGWTKAQAVHFGEGGVFDQIYRG